VSRQTAHLVDQQVPLPAVLTNQERMKLIRAAVTKTMAPMAQTMIMRLA
jgi:hypothetical protein